MSRSATATAAAAAFRQHERERRRVRPPAVVARRVSGAVRPPNPPADGRALAISEAALAPRAPRVASRPPLRLAAGGAAIALRVAETAMEVSGSRTMDRLVRSRAWVLIIGFGLIGIVAMQVSMLKLNAGISRAADTVTTLERNNQALKAQVSTLSSGDRIQALAAQRGFVMPEPADVTYLRAGDARETAARAAGRMQTPDKSIAGPAGSVTVAQAAAAAEAKAAADAAAAQVATAATPPTTTAAPASTMPATPATTDAAATAAVTPAAATATAAGGAAPQTGVTLP